MTRTLAILAVSAAFAASAAPASAGGSNDQPAPAQAIVYNGHAGLGSNGTASSFTAPLGSGKGS
jgi:hypothetical protein